MGRTKRVRNRRHRKSKTVQIVQIVALVIALWLLLYFRDTISNSASLFVDSMGQSEDIVQPPSEPDDQGDAPPASSK